MPTAENPAPAEDTVTAASFNELKALVLSTNDMTKEMHRILAGDPQYKRKGLVEIVDKHDALIKRGGGIFFGVYCCWEALKLIHHLSL